MNGVPPDQRPETSILLHGRAFARARAKARSMKHAHPAPQPAVRLLRDFDPARLVSDWDALSGYVSRPQPGMYHSGGWCGLSLVSPGGNPNWAGADIPAGARPARTPLLAQTPYVASLLDELPCPVVSARLLSLAPGARIEPHRDSMMDLSAGTLRLHVPVVTRPQVEFIVGGVRYALEPGTLWYSDFSRVHHVANPTAVARVHLVIDAVATSALLALFPSHYIAMLDDDQLFVPPEPLQGELTDLPDDALHFEVPPMFCAALAEMRALSRAAAAGERMRAELLAAPPPRFRGSFARSAEGPLLLIDDEPFAPLTPLSPTSFQMQGFAPCVTGRFEGEAVTFSYKTWTLARCELRPFSKESPP